MKGPENHCRVRTAAVCELATGQATYARFICLVDATWVPESVYAATADKVHGALHAALKELEA